MSSSFAGKVGIPFVAPYSAAKHAMHGYFESLRYALSNLGGLLVCAKCLSTLRFRKPSVPLSEALLCIRTGEKRGESSVFVDSSCVCHGTRFK